MSALAVDPTDRAAVSARRRRRPRGVARRLVSGAAWGLVLGALSLAIACSGPTPAPHDERLGALAGDNPPLDSLARRHARLRERLTRRGYDVMARQARTFVLEARGVAIPVDLDATRCHTFALLGSTGIRSLHAILYDGDGVEVASDAVPREGALIHTCPQSDDGPISPHHLVVLATSGSGSVAITQATSAPGRGEGFEGLFDDILAPTGSTSDVEQALSRSRTALRARGFAMLGEPTIERLSDRGTARMNVQLSSERCYVAIARGGQGIEDLDLYLFDGNGAEVGRELSHGAEASIEHCPSESAPYVLLARAYRGSGAVGLGAFAGPRGQPPADHAEGRELDEAFTLERRADAPDLQLSVAVADLVEQGFGEPTFLVRSAVINPREVLSHDLVLGPGCVLVSAVGSDEAMDLDLYLADPNGREIDVDTDTRSSAMVRTCVSAATVVRVAVKVYGRDGTYALASLRAPRDVADVLSLRLAELTAEPRARGYEPRSSELLELAEDERRTGEITLEPGRCLVVALAGDASLRDVDLVLFDAEARVLASDRGPAAHATSGWCVAPSEPGPVVVTWEAHAFRGAGSVRVETLEGAF